MIKGHYGTYPAWLIIGFRVAFVLAILALVVTAALWFAGALIPMLVALMVFGFTGAVAGHFISFGARYQ